MKKYILILIVVCFASQMQAQSPEQLLEYEQKIASGELSEEQLYDHYNRLMRDYYTKDPEKTKFYFREFIKLAREKNNIEQESRALKRIGWIYSEWEGEYRDSVFLYLDKSLSLIEGKGYFKEESSHYEVRGNIYKKLSDYNKSLESYQKARELSEQYHAGENGKEDKSHAARFEINMLANSSHIYSMLSNYEKALEYMLQAKDVMDKNEDVDFSMIEHELIGNLADSYISLLRYEDAYPFIEKAYELAAEQSDYDSMVFGLTRLSDFHLEHRKDTAKALSYAEQAMQLAEKMSMPVLLRMADSALMRVYIKMKKYETALYHAERILSTVETDDWQGLIVIYSDLSLIHALMGHLDEAKDYLAAYDEIVIKITDENLQVALQEMEVKYDVQGKELEIVRQQAEIDRRETLGWMLGGGLAAAGVLLALLGYALVLRTRQRRTLAEANATKDSFFSIISHDLKNPAIAQRDALQMLANHSGQWDADSLATYYRELLKSADGQVELLYNLLNWAQVQTGRMPYRPVRFDLAAALRPDIDLVRSMADRKGVAFEAAIPETALVTGDSSMIATVVRNLLTNAVKFTPAGGSVSLRVEAAAGGWRIAVRDTGVGMSAEQIADLFRIDTRRSLAGTAGEQGSGLGLIVCRELLEKHGTRLEIESKEGHGSEFSFTLYE